MKNASFLASLLLVIALVCFSGCAAEGKKAQAPATGQPEFKLPPGWTEADMQACMIAGTPGEQQKNLLKDVGVWKGKNTMWMYPGAEPVTTEATSTVTSFMDGRYTKVVWAGEMPGMGPYEGFGLQGFDNVSKKYVNLWVDNHSTGLMTGTGVLSVDGKTMSWHFDYICPITMKPAVFRQIETTHAPGKKTLDMFGADPKTGKEFKMMTIELTKK